MTNNKVTLHRVLTASPEKVFRAFYNADAFSNGFGAGPNLSRKTL